MPGIAVNSLNPIYVPLRVSYGVVPVVAGLDKFTNLLVDWQAYLPSFAADILPISPSAFMMVVGVIEILAGLLVLTEAVDELPADLRAVFTLRIVEGLDTNETAECLQISAANVKVRLHRARELLRSRFVRRTYAGQWFQHRRDGDNGHDGQSLRPSGHGAW